MTAKSTLDAVKWLAIAAIAFSLTLAAATVVYDLQRPSKSVMKVRSLEPNSKVSLAAYLTSQRHVVIISADDPSFVGEVTISDCSNRVLYRRVFRRSVRCVIKPEVGGVYALRIASRHDRAVTLEVRYVDCEGLEDDVLQTSSHILLVSSTTLIIADALQVVLYEGRRRAERG